MTRKEIHDEIRGTLGIVPTFLKEVPDSTLDLQWEKMKRIEFEESPIPAKYPDLMGIAISAVTKCRYCARFHTEAARVNGATEEEIKDAVRYAGWSSSWSAWLNGLQFDYDEYSEEIDRIGEHLRRHMREASHAR